VRRIRYLLQKNSKRKNYNLSALFLAPQNCTVNWVTTYILKRTDKTGIRLAIAAKVLMAQQLHGEIF
jgi:hypothetical protein